MEEKEDVVWDFEVNECFILNEDISNEWPRWVEVVYLFETRFWWIKGGCAPSI